jgi:hypothetical protein
MSLLLAWTLHISAYAIKLSGPFLIHDWTRRVPLVVQEFRIFPEHLSSPLVFSGVRVMCIGFRSLFVPLSIFFWPLYCLSFFDLRILITPLVSFGHCVVCPSSIYAFWLPLWYLQSSFSIAFIFLGTGDLSHGSIRMAA